MKFNKQKIIEFSLWSVVIATFFLPFMHDRYLYLGDILSVVYFIYNKDKIYIPIGICGISAYCYAIYLYQCNAIQMPIVSIAYLVIVVLLTKDLYDKYLKEKEIENIKEEVLKQQ